MRDVDSSISIGVVWGSDHWNDTVLDVAGSIMDYIIIHKYYPAYFSTPENEPLKNYFKYLLAAPQQFSAYYNNVLELLDRSTGRPGKVGIAVTEYNGSYKFNKPIPYRHTLGNALYIADLVGVMLQPDNRIIMANFWQFINEWFGAISGPYESYERGPLIKRPQYYSYQMYHEYFQPLLIETKVDCPSYTITSNRKYNRVKPATVPYLSVNASRLEEGNTVCLMVINKHPDEPMATRVDVPGFDFDNKIQIHTLNGPSMEATNEFDPGNVIIKSECLEFVDTIRVVFPPHSLSCTVIRTD